MFDTPYHESIVMRINAIDRTDSCALIQFDTLLELVKDTTIPMGHRTEVALAIERKAAVLGVVRPSPVLNKAAGLVQLLRQAENRDPNWVQKNLERIRREEQKLLDIAAQIS